MKIEKRGIILQFDENTLTYSMERDHQTWKWPKNYVPRMICEEGEFCFRDACQISHEVIHFGTGEGIHSRFKGFKKDGEEIPYHFETLVWIEEASGDVFFEWIPVEEEGLHVLKVLWPGEMEFDEARDVLRDVHAVTRVRIGTNVSFGISAFPKIFSEFSRRYPQIPLYTKVENSRQIEEHLMRNELDFGIMDYPLNPRFFVCSPIGKDSMTAVCAQDYPVKESITMEELCEHPLLLREKGSGSRNMAEGFMEKYKRKQNIVMESISVQSLIEACSK